MSSEYSCIRFVPPFREWRQISCRSHIGDSVHVSRWFSMPGTWFNTDEADWHGKVLDLLQRRQWKLGEWFVDITTICENSRMWYFGTNEMSSSGSTNSMLDGCQLPWILLFLASGGKGEDLSSSIGGVGCSETTNGIFRWWLAIESGDAGGEGVHTRCAVLESDDFATTRDRIMGSTLPFCVDSSINARITRLFRFTMFRWGSHSLNTWLLFLNEYSTVCLFSSPWWFNLISSQVGD